MEILHKPDGNFHWTQSQQAILTDYRANVPTLANFVDDDIKLAYPLADTQAKKAIVAHAQKFTYPNAPLERLDITEQSQIWCHFLTHLLQEKNSNDFQESDSADYIREVMYSMLSNMSSSTPYIHDKKLLLIFVVVHLHRYNDFFAYSHIVWVLQNHPLLLPSLYDLQNTNPSEYQRLQKLALHLYTQWKNLNQKNGFKPFKERIISLTKWNYSFTDSLGVKPFLYFIFPQKQDFTVNHKDNYSQINKVWFIHSDDVELFKDAYHHALFHSPHIAQEKLLPPLLNFLAKHIDQAIPLLERISEDKKKKKLNHQLLHLLKNYQHDDVLLWLLHHLEPANIEFIQHWLQTFPLYTLEKVACKRFSAKPKNQSDEFYDISKKFQYLSTSQLALTHLMVETLVTDDAELLNQLKIRLSTHHPDVLEDMADVFAKIQTYHLPVSTTEAIPDILLDPPWQSNPNQPCPKLPEMLSISSLPSLVLEKTQQALPLAYVENFLGILSLSDYDQLMPPLTPQTFKALLTCFTRESLNDLGLALYKIKGEDWLIYSLGWLINESAVADIQKMIKGKCKTERASQIRRLMINALAKNYDYFDNKVALQALFFLQEGKRLRHHVDITIQEIVDKTGKSTSTLFDSSLPDLGFNINAERILTVDGINITLRVDNHLVLIHDDLNTDDTKVTKASQQIKMLQIELNKFYAKQKSQLKNELKAQVFRSIQDFKDVFLQHPLLQTLAKTIVWGLFKQVGQSNQLINAFIITDDGAWLTQDYDEIAHDTLTDDKTDEYLIAILHPVYIQPSDASQLLKLLAEHDTIPLFYQMSEPFYKLTEEEKSLQKITRFRDKNLSEANLFHCRKTIKSKDKRQDIGLLFENNQTVLPVFIEKHVGQYQITIEDIDIQDCHNLKLISDVIGVLTDNLLTDNG